MRKYSFFDELLYAATNKTIAAISGETTVRSHMYKVIWSCKDTPADVQVSVDIAYSIAIDGTSSTFTPQVMDKNTVAALSECRGDYTGEGTYAAPASVKFSFHQANTYRWEELPEDGLVDAAVAGRGYGVRLVAVSGGTPTVGANVFFGED